VNQLAFENGYAAYRAGDWARAATEFSQAKSIGEHAGRVDHLLGNCLMKLGRYDDAAAAYGEALKDDTYGMKGALCTNRGRALVAAGRLQEAVEVLAEATNDKSYATPYKAYTAMGGAYKAMGDVRSAGIAYRNAAIDETNPNPSASLRKLGGCFMELGRPADAVESYRTALDFSSSTKANNAIYCDLALAYVATNRMSEAVDAFDHATADGTLELSSEAQAAYDAARDAIAVQNAKTRSDTDDLLASSGYGDYPIDPLDPTGATSGNLMPSPEDTGFFSVSEEDIIQDERRRRRGRGGRIFAVIIVLILLLAGVAGFAYYSGFGWPTQESVVEGLFEQKKDGGDVAQYVSGSLSSEARDQVIALVPADATDVSINGVERSMSNSSVDVTATLAEGGEQSYTVSLVRDGIGWKVSDFEARYASLGDDAAVETEDEKAKDKDKDKSKDENKDESAEAEQPAPEEAAPAENAEGEQAEAPVEGEVQNDDAATSEGTVSE